MSEYSFRNKAKIKAKRIQYHIDNPGKIRERRIKMHNITPDQYEALIEAQGGGCAICGLSLETGGKELAIDHDHTCCEGIYSCGACIRGVLCQGCNGGLGLFRDTPEFLRSAANYLEKSDALPNLLKKQRDS